MKRENFSRVKEIVGHLDDIEYNLQHLSKDLSTVSVTTDRTIYFSTTAHYPIEHKFCKEVKVAALNFLNALKEQLEKELETL